MKMKMLHVIVARQRCLAHALVRPSAAIALQSHAPHLRHALQAHPHVRAFSSTATGFRCNDCGASFVKWQGQCSSCHAWGAVVPATHAAPLYRQSNAATFGHGHKKAKPHHAHSVAWAGASNSSNSDHAIEELVLRMNEVQGDAAVERIQLPERELVRLVLHL